MKKLCFAVLLVWASVSFVGCGSGKPKVDLLPAPPANKLTSNQPVQEITSGDTTQAVHGKAVASEKESKPKKSAEPECHDGVRER